MRFQVAKSTPAKRHITRQEKKKRITGDNALVTLIVHVDHRILFRDSIAI